MKRDRKDALIILCLFLIAFLIRVSGIFNVCMVEDEWLYWSQTNRILANNLFPAENTFCYESPFLTYIGALITLISESDLNTLRMISVIFGSLTVPLLYLFGKTIYDRKTGALSALFLCFSAYHCFYSRIYKLEAFTIFFISAFLYFFWLSEKRESMKYAIIAGIMMGLAIDAKYISLFIIPSVISFFLWKENFALTTIIKNKRVILIFTFAFLFFLPLLIGLYLAGVGLYPFYFYSVGIFERTETSTRVIHLSMSEILTRWKDAMLHILAWGADLLIPPFAEIFKLFSLSTFLLTLLFYFFSFLKREKEGSFLMISLLILIFVLLIYKAGEYLLLYLLPFYFVMLSHITMQAFNHLKMNKRSIKGIYVFTSMLMILIVITILFFSFITSFTSPYWDRGGHSWIKSGIDFIKRDLEKNHEEDEIIIGTFLFTDEPLAYYADTIDLNASMIRMPVKREYTREIKATCIERIKKLKPEYIIIHKQSVFYRYYFKGKMKEEVFKDYNVVFQSQSYPYECIVMKRKDFQLLNISKTGYNGDNSCGIIFEDAFRRSIPYVMKVGDVYTAVVKVKNTGNLDNNFIIHVYSEKFIVFIEENFREIALNSGSTCFLKFKIVPLREHIGEIPISADLYARDKNGELKKIYSISDHIYLIK